MNHRALEDAKRIKTLEKALEDLVEVFDTAGDVYRIELRSGDSDAISEEASEALEYAMHVLYDEEEYGEE